jgi:hypothetical protein
VALISVWSSVFSVDLSVTSRHSEAAQRPDRDVAEVNLVALNILLQDEYGSSSPSQHYLSLCIWLSGRAILSRVRYAPSLLMQI